MKSSQLTSILMGLTAFCALAAAFLCMQTISRGREVRQLQPQVMQVQQRRQLTGMMLGELNEYGKKNPQIVPILQSLMSKPATTNNVAR